MTGLTHSELMYFNQRSNLDASKFCSPRLEELSLVYSPIATSALLAPGGLQSLKKIHYEDDQRSAPNEESSEASRESCQQCERLLQLPQLHDYIRTLRDVQPRHFEAVRRLAAE